MHMSGETIPEEQVITETVPKNEGILANLNADSFSFMMIKKPFTKSWSFGLTIFAIQATLLSLLILKDQIESTSLAGTPFNIPYFVTAGVRTTQVLSIFITIATSYDVVLPVKDLITTLRLGNVEEWSKIVAGMLDSKTDDADPDINHYTCKIWFLHILFPNIIKFIEGMLVMSCSFVIIIQSDNVIDLCKDFAAISLIAEFDNVAFYLANLGYFGDVLKNDTKEIETITLNEKQPTKRNY